MVRERGVLFRSDPISPRSPSRQTRRFQRFRSVPRTSHGANLSQFVEPVAETFRTNSLGNFLELYASILIL